MIEWLQDIGLMDVLLTALVGLIGLALRKVNQWIDSNIGAENRVALSEAVARAIAYAKAQGEQPVDYSNGGIEGMALRYLRQRSPELVAKVTGGKPDLLLGRIKAAMAEK